MLSHCMGLAKVNRFILLITSERGSVTGKECNSLIPPLTCCLLHVPSDTTQQVLQIGEWFPANAWSPAGTKSTRKKGTKKNLNRYSPILLIRRKSFEPASYYTVIHDRGVENVFLNPSKYSVMSITWGNSHGRHFGFIILAVQCK